MPNERPLPPGSDSPQAKEILRWWLVPGDKMIASLDVGAFPDSRAWGIALADLARYIARAYEVMKVGPQEKILTSIVDMFEAEIGKPTSETHVVPPSKPN